MDLFDVVRACFRRWYVALPLILVTGWFAMTTYQSVKPVYYTNAVIGLSGPSMQVVYDPKVIPHNGLLETGGPALIANLVVLGLRDPEIKARVVDGGGQPNYNTYLFPVPANTPALPLVTVDTTQPDPESATKTVSLVMAQIGSVLESIQRNAGVPDDMMVRPISATPPQTPTPGVPSRTRSTIAIMAGGVGIAVVIAVLFDVVLSRMAAARSSRKRPSDNRPPSSPSHGDALDNDVSPRGPRAGAAAHKQ